MTKRYGRAVDRIPYDQLPPSGSPAHELGIGYTASPAQLSDDAWRAQFEDHLSDGSPSKPKKT